MRQRRSLRGIRLVAAALVASLTVFALAGSIHNHDLVGRAGGASLAATKSEQTVQAKPCIACLLAHSACTSPLTFEAAKTFLPAVAKIQLGHDRPASMLVDRSSSPRGPPSSTIPTV
jgi:hypothetical protein